MMSEKIEKLVEDVRTELLEILVADKEDAGARVFSCLLHAETLIGTFIRKEFGHVKDSGVD